MAGPARARIEWAIQFHQTRLDLNIRLPVWQCVSSGQSKLFEERSQPLITHMRPRGEVFALAGQVEPWLFSGRGIGASGLMTVPDSECQVRITYSAGAHLTTSCQHAFLFRTPHLRRYLARPNDIHS